MEKIRFGLATAAILGLAGCGGGGSNNTFIPVVTNTATLHQFVYVATQNNGASQTGGIETYSVSADGTVSQGTTVPVNDGNVVHSGLAVVPSANFLVMAINTGTPATSGLQVFTINPNNGALTAGPLNASVSAASIPEGPIAVDSAGQVGAFADSQNRVEGFVINSDGSTTVSPTISAQANVNTLSITTVNAQDVLVVGMITSTNSVLLNSTGAIGGNVSTTGTGAFEQSLATVVGTTGALLESNFTLATNAQPFTVDSTGTLTLGTATGLAESGAVPYNSISSFVASSVAAVAATTSSTVLINSVATNVFLSVIQQTGLTLGASATAPGTPVGSTAVLPVAGSGGVPVLVVVSQSATNVTEVSSFATNGSTTLQSVNTVTDSAGATPGSNGQKSTVSNSIVGSVTAFF